MKGLTVTTSSDYIFGPGPRVVLTIDCEEFCTTSLDSSLDWHDKDKSIFVEAIKDAYTEMAKLNSSGISIILKNYKVEHVKFEEIDYEYDRFNIDLDKIFLAIWDSYSPNNIWVHIDEDFHTLMTTANFHDDILFSSHDCKSDIYFVCGKYDPNHSYMMIKGRILDEFPVKPVNRRSFNQRIWKADGHVQRDVTSKIDENYNEWKSRNLDI